MRYNDISGLSDDEVKNKILNDCKAFHDEFISNGIKVYRIQESTETFIKQNTIKKRKPFGWLGRFPSSITDYLDKILFTDNGICSRIHNALYTITSSPDSTAVGISGEQYWCVPIGNYTYSYISGIEDFNYPNDDVSFLNTAKSCLLSISNIYEIELSELKLVIECSDSDLKSVVADLFGITTVDGNDDAVKFLGYVEKARDAISKIPSAYTNNRITDTLYKPTEVLFNCESFYLFSVEKYDLMDIFGIDD